MNPVRPHLTSPSPSHLADPDGQGLTTAATTQAQEQAQEGEDLQVVMLELSPRELELLRAENPVLAQQVEAQARPWEVGGLVGGTLRQLGPTAGLAVVPLLKQLSGSFAAAYGLAIPFGQVLGAAITKLLSTTNSREFAVAPENTASLRNARFSIASAGYFVTLSAAEKLPEHLSGPALTATGLTIAAVSGQMIQHLPFLVQHLMGHEVSERDLKALPGMSVMLSAAISAGFAALAGGEVDIAKAVTNSLTNNNSTSLEGASADAAAFVPIALAVLTYAALATYAGPKFQAYLTRAAPSAQNQPAPGATNTDEAAAAAAAVNQDPELGLAPEIELGTATSANQAGSTLDRV